MSPVPADGAARPAAGRSGSGRSGPGRPPGGSEQKKAAIVQAALRLFLRDGFARTSVDAIADEAGVSKRTIYNYYADKEDLFLSVVRETYDSLIAVVTALTDRYLADVPADQLEQRVVGFATEVALVAARSPDRSMLIRLMMTEAPYFPELRQVQMRPRGVTSAIASRLAALAARGLLDISDPDEAANHLFALTIGQLNNRSLFGTVALTDEEITRLADGGARAFLRAYRSAPASASA